MLINKKLIQYLKTMLVISAIIGCMPVFSAENQDKVSQSNIQDNQHLEIKDVSADLSGKLLFLFTNEYNKPINYNISKLSSPERVVVEISNATWAGAKKSINFSNLQISNIKIAQFSTKPDVVRLVFTGDTPQSFKNLSFTKSKNCIIFKLGSVEPTKVSTPLLYTSNYEEIADINDSNTKLISNIQQVNQSLAPIPNEVSNVITPNSNNNMLFKSISHSNNHITLTGTGIASIKEPFVLKNPTRIVYDLPDSSVNSVNLLKRITLKNGDLVRIGQFDDKTLRVVIQTNDPDFYQSIISPDLQTIVLTQKNELSLSEIPNSKIISLIQDIKVVKKDNLTTSITFMTNKPLIHSIKKGKLLTLDLYNVNAPAKSMVTNLPLTNQFNGVNVKFMEQYPNGSRWNFSIAKNIKVETRLSIDGRALELTFKEQVEPISNSSLAVALSGGSKEIVLDPGHGGTEPGAMRNGIYEKDINLAVAKLVRKYVQAAGINVVMTRTDDATLSLGQRTDITDKEKPSIFVSVHVNSSTSSLAKGTETHWYNSEDSRVLATTIQKKLGNEINSPDRGIQKSRFYVINHTNVPAVLVEIGFISNDGERSNLLDYAYQNSIAKSISNGIIQYLNNK